MNQQNIRNFCIIAHIDHGKSTLADRFLEMTNTISKRDLLNQTLDSMDLEREKGITIKLKAVRMNYKVDNTDYQLNLIDTPGHVDFAYEVSRSLAACEGAILVIDGTQGIQAQTVSNVYKALESNLKIIPVINKIDVIGADIEKVERDIINMFGFNKEEILHVSAKTGLGVENLLKEVVKQVPAPLGSKEKPTRALIFDSFYDEYLGVMASIRVIDGEFNIEKGNNKVRVSFCATKYTATPEEIGIYNPKRKNLNVLSTGEVGYIATGLKDIKAVKVGDTITLEEQKGIVEPLEGYKEVKPFVFVSIYPIDNDKFPQLREALQKLALSDSSLSFEPENNTALGFGFRCGFLGLLHADIIQERLEREYNLQLISTIPSVEYIVTKTNGKEITIKNPEDFPDRSTIKEVTEPWLKINIVTPNQFTGAIITLCEERRGVMNKMTYPNEDTVIFEYELPLAELVFNFFDDLKTKSSGYASLDYDFIQNKPVDAVKLNILVHGDVVEPLSMIVLKQKAPKIGRNVLKKLKEILPRQQFQVSLQAAIGGKIIAREDISALRKNVLAKMSGGHRERKDKLLEIQKKGKQRMKKVGKVDIPQQAFREILKS